MEQDVTPLKLVENEPIVEAKIETPIVEEPKAVETPKTEEVKPKLWEDEFKSHFSEYENVDKVKEVLNEYKTKAEKAKEYEEKLSQLEKSKFEFADEKVKTTAEILNRLSKEGKGFDEKLISFLNKDYTKESTPLELMYEGLKLEHPDWTEKELKFELKERYKLDSWAKDEDDEKPEIQDVMEEKLARESEIARKKLIEKQAEYKIEKPKTPEQIESERAESESKIKNAELAKKQWNEFTKELSSKKPKVTVDLTDETQKEIQSFLNGTKEKVAPFDFEIAQEDKEKASALFGAMGEDLNKFWGLFADEKGNYTNKESLEKIFDFVQKTVIQEKMQNKLAVHQYKKALEFIVKNDKKVNFEPNNTQTNKGDTGKLKLAQPK